MKRSDIEDLRYSVLRDVEQTLSATIGASSLLALSEHISLFEKVVEEISLRNLASMLSLRSTSNVVDSRTVVVDGERFHINASKHIDKPTKVIGIVGDAIDSRNELLEHKIGGWGKYDKIEILIDEKLLPLNDRICTTTVGVYIASYEWLRRKISQLLMTLGNQSAEDLYSCLRNGFSAAGADELLVHVRLGIVYKDEMYYLLDPEASEAVVQKLNNNIFYQTTGPAESLITLITYPLLYGDSLSRFAVNENAAKEFSLHEADYSSDQPIYHKTERELIEGDKITVLPLETEKRIKLTANFPTKYKGDIEPLITKRSADLREIHLTHLDKVGSYIQSVKSNVGSLKTSETGEFLGGFLAGATKAFTYG